MSTALMVDCTGSVLGWYNAGSNSKAINVSQVLKVWKTRRAGVLEKGGTGRAMCGRLGGATSNSDTSSYLSLAELANIWVSVTGFRLRV